MTRMTDIYFTKAKLAGHELNPIVTWGVFMRHETIAAIEPALLYLKTECGSGPGPESGLAKIERHFEEGAIVPAETPLFSYTGNFCNLVELETSLLQLTGFSCISAVNAYKMATACPRKPFIDMSARHTTGPEMAGLCAYGASIGSKTARAQGAKGFIGSSVIETSHLYGTPTPIGTMPHVLIGVCGSTLSATRRLLQNNPEDTFIVALVDYYGKEYTDSLEVAGWFKDRRHDGKILGVRLDTDGARFAEGLTYNKSIEIMEDWLHIKGKWPLVKSVMGDEAFDATDDHAKDRVASTLFGTGVSVASIVHMRSTLDHHAYRSVKIVASSGFNLRKCQVMARAKAPIDYIGTGSFLPSILTEAYATCDAYKLDGKPQVKAGREKIFAHLI